MAEEYEQLKHQDPKAREHMIRYKKEKIFELQDQRRNVSFNF